MDKNKLNQICHNCRFTGGGVCPIYDFKEGYTEIIASGSCKKWEGNESSKGKIERRALEILKEFPDINTQPASISGKFHIGETIMEHLERTASVMRHLCDGMNIRGEDRDMLIACAYLHDLGKLPITLKGEIKASGWRYHEASGWSRIDEFMKVHGILSAMVLDNYRIPRREEIKRIISTHMGYWYANNYNPRPHNLFEYLMVEADYLATRPQELTKFTGENQK